MGFSFIHRPFSQDAKHGFATEIDEVLEKLGLEKDSKVLVDSMNIGILQPSMLTSEADIQQEINKFSNAKKLAVVRTGSEAWGLISYGDDTFDLFDPHGRNELNTGNSAAFIKRTNLQGANSHIWNYSPWKNLSPTENEHTKLTSAVYIYWLK